MRHCPWCHRPRGRPGNVRIILGQSQGMSQRDDLAVNRACLVRGATRGRGFRAARAGTKPARVAGFFFDARAAGRRRSALVARRRSAPRDGRDRKARRGSGLGASSCGYSSVSAQPLSSPSGALAMSHSTSAARSDCVSSSTGGSSSRNVAGMSSDSIAPSMRS